MVEAELEHWALKSKWGPARIDWMRKLLDKCHRAAASPDLSRLWAQVVFEAGRVGRTIDTADAWNAATAILYDIPLVTNNASDYRGVPGLKIFSGD
jgi:predicted nucleic acid-binding protein